MTGMTLLRGTQRDHLALGQGLGPACGSRARIDGFHFAADGHVETTVDRICNACLSRLRVEITTELMEPTR